MKNKRRFILNSDFRLKIFEYKDLNTLLTWFLLPQKNYPNLL